MTTTPSKRLVLDLIILAATALAFIALLVENSKLRDQLTAQTETTEYAIRELEKCSGHLKEISKEVKAILK